MIGKIEPRFNIEVDSERIEQDCNELKETFIDLSKTLKSNLVFVVSRNSVKVFKNI